MVSFPIVLILTADLEIPIILLINISLVTSLLVQKIQLAATRLLSVLFIVGDDSSSCAFGNAYFGLDEKQV